ncbi:G-type lectin S-receptor-like serine/threonine-protein kinase SD1-1 isoform X2 [Pistacia vera]|uniref:G-type lectin S-receptor-like serine/threonine-protein kinase SD1-1 isoform X2 n=1 Tax=Pistacia vera TaxID=55513 RepID=UPI001262B7DD|nr:G-type lectin S-receptor-like serine/threonine-protein kinase SD1-1 isoform X2 [Pistacia vera]
MFAVIKSVNDSRKRKVVKIVLVVSTVAGFFILVMVLCKAWKKRKNKGKKEVQTLTSMEKRKGEIEVPLFDLATIAAATNNFSNANLIGEGGFGPVYKGNLSEGQEIAVKRLSRKSGQGLEEFMNEVILIGKLQHRNLVALVGSCIEGDERMLIYEYLPNKSLDNFIFDRERSKLLSWKKRLDIVIWIARGLLYLHQDSKLQIVHRDLKTSNILLDIDLNPKISDFGLARIFASDDKEVNTKRVVGTYGYMSPEYATEGTFSLKSDVFSFGVLLLEIISGRRNRGFRHQDHHHNLLGHAWLLWNDGRALDLMDTCLEDSFIESLVQRCIQVGLLCVQKFPENRPEMSSVVFMLGNEEVVLPQPKQPGFFTEISFSTDTTSSKDKLQTENALSITIQQGR